MKHTRINRRHFLGQASKAAGASGVALLGMPLIVTGPQAWGQASGVGVGEDQTEQRFALGVASGEPTSQGMVLWTRLMGANLPEDQAVPVQWEVAEDEQFTRIAARGVEQAEALWAHSVHAQPQGLQPNRPYWYRFTAMGQRSPVGLTRTAPSADAAAASLRFIIASCQRYDVGHFAAWRHAAAWKPELILFLGDYIYETATPPGRVRRHDSGYVSTLSQYRARYAHYKRDPHLQAAHACAPWMVIWDDHEVDNDYAGLQGQRLQPRFEAQRLNAYQAYWEHMPLPQSMRPDLSARGGSLKLYRSHDWGRLARIHLLDDRQYRAPQVCPKPGRGGSNTVTVQDCPDFLDPQRSLLGLEQEQWLQQNWDLSRPWNLLAQQTLMSRWSWTDPQGPTRGTYWTDGWDGYPLARQRLLQTVADKKVPGVVVLGGDVHANYVADLKLDPESLNSPAVASEFCGTSITSEGLPQDRVQAAWRFNPHVHFARSDQRGFVAFELDAHTLRAQLQVVNDVLDPNSDQRTAARFAVEAARPGVMKA